MDDIIHGRYRKWGKKQSKSHSGNFHLACSGFGPRCCCIYGLAFFLFLVTFCTHVEIVVKSMPKRRKSSKQLEKDREENRERMSEFCKKKTEEQALKDSLARQQALKQLGITQEFNYSDHAEIYSYADRAHAAPIETIEASIPPPEITQYPERSPCPSPCSVRGEQINHAWTPTARTAVARFRRAKTILQAHCAK